MRKPGKTGDDLEDFSKKRLAGVEERPSAISARKGSGGTAAETPGRDSENERPLPQGRKGAGGVNGADRDRTDNLLDATEALSQLSYGPA